MSIYKYVIGENIDKIDFLKKKKKKKNTTRYLMNKRQLKQLHLYNVIEQNFHIQEKKKKKSTKLYMKGLITK